MHAYRADRAFDGDRMLPDGALVLVDGGSVVGVEPAYAAVPDGVPVTHLPGTTLLPGLVESHSHLCADGGPRALDQLPELDDATLDEIVRTSLRTQLASGVTAVRDLGDAHWTVVDRHRGHPDLPHVVGSGPPVTIPGGHCANMGGEAAGRDALVTAVAERVERGADVVKVMTSGGMLTQGTDVTAPQYPLDDLRLIVETAHAAGLAVTGHAHAVRAVALCVEAGVDGIEHCSCVTGTGLGATPDLVERLAESGIAVCPTLGRLPGVDEPPRIQALLEELGISFDGIVEQTGRLVTGGVRIIGGTDSGITPNKPHGIVGWGVVDLVTAGATVADALASVTGRAADAIGLADRTGRLRPGLSADLLLVDGDVTADVAAVARPRLVVLRGEVVHSG